MKSRNKKDVQRLCVVYMITNPVGEVYIGASHSVYSRFHGYELSLSDNINLKKSLIEFGFASHKKEFLMLLPQKTPRRILTFWENLHWRIKYACGIKLMNITIPGVGGITPDMRTNYDVNLHKKNVIISTQ